MARLDKWKRKQMAPIVKEATRQLSSYKNKVDLSRSHMNYTLVGGEDYKSIAQSVDKRIRDVMGSKIKAQTKANMRPLGTWVITLPQELKGLPEEEQRRFFEVCTDFVKNRYGEDNVAYAIVHNDETTPHIHIGVIPACVSRKTGKMTVSAASMFDKNDLNTYHDDLDAVIAREFGQAGLMKNGRTKGNYTLDEMNERDRIKAELDEREKGVRVQVLTAQKRERMATVREKVAEDSTKKADKVNEEAKSRMESVNQRTRELNEHVARVNAFSEQLNAKEARLKKREAELNEKERQLKEKEIDLKRRETLLERAMSALRDFADATNQFTQKFRSALEWALNRKSEDDRQKVLDKGVEYREKVVEPSDKVFAQSEIDPETLIDDLEQPTIDAYEMISDLEVNQPSALER